MFHDTVKEMLPDPRKLDEVLKWKFDAFSDGLLMVGPTRSGNTRCAWELVKREVEAGRNVMAMDSMAYFIIMAARSKSSQVASDWMSARCECDILFMDDPFKAHMDDMYDSALSFIINQRADKRLPMIVTANDVGASLEARMSNRGKPMVARLLETCRQVAFSKTKEYTEAQVAA